MHENINLINPNLLTQVDDYLGSGIPYMPYPLAYLASELKKNNYNINVIDAFGEKVYQLRREGKFYIQGLFINEIIERIDSSAKYIIIYYSTIMAHSVILNIYKAIKEKYSDLIIILIENSESVIGCSLEYIKEELLNSGIDYIVVGEPEKRVLQLLDLLDQSKLELLKSMDGIAYMSTEGIVYQPKKSYIHDLDSLSFPGWEYFPIENYWKLKYSHGPFENKKYLALLTSRGCPFNCNFCIIPATNGKTWRYRSPENIVAEIEYMINKFGVYEYHLEDVNPTANEKRIIDFCQLLIKNKLKIKWKLASGSKIETMKIKTLKLMKEAGCNYISFSPESGSSRVLQLMNKPFDRDYALLMTKEMHKCGIYSQACFVLGYPGEINEDLQNTFTYVKQLVKKGVDEIALFIMTPIPGTKTYGMVEGFKDYSELTFSPSWRDDYIELSKFRDRLYFRFLLWKIAYHPIKVLVQFLNLARKRFKTKAEMNIYRIYKTKMFIRDNDGYI